MCQMKFHIFSADSYCLSGGSCVSLVIVRTLDSNLCQRIYVGLPIYGAV